MSYKSCFSFLLLVFAVLFFARDAHACSCSQTPTVLDAFERADFVVITKVVSVEKTEKAAPKGRMSDGENYVNGVKSTRMIIERVYKGSLKAGDEITFGQGGGANCIWTFSEESIGEQFLFYLNSNERSPGVWYAGTCGRSNGLRYANDDLLYLNDLERVRGKTRLSGTVRFYDGGARSVEGKKIRITGAKKTYELETNKHGVYEIYDLPAGQYVVETEPPAGWKLMQYLRFGNDADGKKESPNKMHVALEARKHANLDIYFEIDNVLRGKVYDPDGRPLRDVCLDLVPAQIDPPQYFYKADCTDEEGKFAIEEVPAGSYYLVVNKRGNITSRAPFKTLYYPGVSEREKAAVIAIGAGQTLEGFDVRVPQAEETITVEGVLRYSDGKPVAGEGVEFKAANSNAEIDGDARARTDATGRFSIKILKDVEGELSGEMFAYAGEFENCPKLEALIKEWGNRVGELKTDAVKIQAGRDLKDVELRFTFPACKKAKKTMRGEGVQQER